MTDVTYKAKMVPNVSDLLLVMISASTKRATISLPKPDLVPGEPFQIKWRFDWQPTKQTNHPTIVANIFWKDDQGNSHVIWQGPEAQKNLWLPFAYMQSIGGTVDVSSSMVPDEFYQPGVKEIHLEVQWKGTAWDGKTSGTATSSDSLEVALDAPIASWWEWTTDTWRPNLDIDEPYSLAGKVTNMHKFADAEALTASLRKWEDGDEGNQHDMKSLMPDNLPLAPKGTANIDFGKFKDHWEWMEDCLVWTFVPSKSYWYQVTLDVIDEFGNHYNDVTSTSGVTSSVPAWTKEKKVASCALSIGGIVTKVIGLFSPVGAALIGGSYYLEDLVTKATLDRAQPDSDFERRVTRPDIPFDPEDAVFGKGLPATRKFLKVGLEIAILDGMRRSIAGKILGARHADQPKSERRQREAYAKISNELNAKVQTLQKLSRDSDAELVQELLRVDMNGLHEIRLERLNGVDKLPPGVLDRFMDFLASPDLAQRIRNSQSLGYAAEALSKAMSVTDDSDAKTLADGVPPAASARRWYRPLTWRRHVG
jgi:hypothetical protein